MTEDNVSRREFCRTTAKVLAAGTVVDMATRGGLSEAASQKPRRRRMKLVITVEKIKGRCPAYKVGDRIVLDSGFKFNLEETTAACMHSLASILPYHIALSKGVQPNQCGLAHKDKNDGKAYVQCLDPCDETGGGTTIFSIERVETD